MKLKNPLSPFEGGRKSLIFRGMRLTKQKGMNQEKKPQLTNHKQTIMKHHLYLLLWASFMLSLPLFGQLTNNVELPTSINTTGNAPDASAILDVQSTSKGMLVPRMTAAQRNAISNPATGLLVFDTSTDGFWFFDGSIWQNLSDSSTEWASHNNGTFYSAFSGNVAISAVPNLNDKLYVYRPSNNNGADIAGIHSYRFGGAAASDGGTGWAEDEVDTAIKSNTLMGNNYSTAIYGTSGLNFNNSAAILGANADASIYGALGYKNGIGESYAGFFQGDINVTGRAVVNGNFYPHTNLYIEQTETGPLKSGLYVRNTASSPTSGTSWLPSGVCSAIRAFSNTGHSYSSGIYSASPLTNINSAAILGAHSAGNVYGALGYSDDGGTMWAGYFNGNVRVADRILINASYGLTANNNLHVTQGSYGAGAAGITSYRVGTDSASGGGIGWSELTVDASIKGVSAYGNNYTAAVYGTSGLNYANSAAVIGKQRNGDAFGALAYKDGNDNIQAGYFNGQVNIKQLSGSTAFRIENYTNTNNWQINMDAVSNELTFYYTGYLQSLIALNGEYFYNSDRNLKTEIEYLDGVLPKVIQLNAAKYYYKSAIDMPQKSHGFIAQEVQQIFPELVHKTGEGTLALAYDNFAVLSIQAIKEQQAIIDNQQKELDNQKQVNQQQVQKNAELEQRLAKLEALLTNSTK